MTAYRQQQSIKECNNIMIERLGGQKTLDLTIVGLAQAIQSDPDLEGFYSSFLFEDLIGHQKQLLTSILQCSDKSSKKEEHLLKSSILLRHYSLIQDGFNEHHFDALVMLFVQELQNSWINSVAIQDAVAILNTVRPIFESSSRLNKKKQEREEKFWNESQLTASYSNDEHSSITATSRSSASRTSSLSLLSRKSFDSSSSSRISKRSDKGKTPTKTRLVEKKDKKLSQQRGSSGEFLLNILRGKGAKRTEQERQ